MVRAVAWAAILTASVACAQPAELPTMASAGSRTVAFDAKGACRLPVFAPGGGRAAVFVAAGGGGEVVVVGVADGAKHVAWSAGGAKAECDQLTFSPDGRLLAALLRFEKDGAVRRSVAVGPADGTLEWLGVEPMAYEFTFSPDGKRIALATKDGIVVAAAAPGASGKLWLSGESTEERRAPYTRIGFAPDGSFVAAVGPIAEPFTVAGEGRGVVVFADGRHVELGVSTPDLAISPDGKRIAAAVWTHSPVRVERPGGLMVWAAADLRAGKATGRFVMDPRKYICGLHVYPGATFWIDGKPACLGTAIEPEPGQVYRRFGVWQADLAGGEPRRLTILGPMPKRMWPDPGYRGRVAWRYNADRGTLLLDERTGRVWRLTGPLAVGQYELAVSDDLRRMAVVKGNELVLHEIEEAK